MGGHDDRHFEPDTAELSIGKLAICLVSGGMDSCVTAAIAREQNRELAFLHVSYGQRTAERELKAFAALADFYQVEKRLTPSIEYLSLIGNHKLNFVHISPQPL